MIVAVLMIWVVNVLLLSAAGRFLGYAPGALRVALAASLGAVLTGAGIVSNSPWWQLGSLVLTGFTAFGLSREHLWGVLLFSLLHLSLGGLTGGREGMLPMLLGAAGIGFACLALGSRETLVSVELCVPTETVRITALRDTGNNLRDPITGRPVLVVDARTAQRLTGLTPQMLAAPVESLTAVQGLRLIPYKTVGGRGFLLALPIPEAKIGNRRGSVLVALSPQCFGNRYQALTGGTL